MFSFFRTRRLAEPVRQESARPGDSVGCFGKLPIQPDFIRHNVSLREAIAADRWVQEGFGLASRYGFTQVPDLPVRVYHGVFAGAEQDRTVLLTARLSRDSSGRSYPFVIFNVAEKRHLHRHPAAVGLAYDAYFRRAGEVVTRPWRTEPVSTLEGWLESLRGFHDTQDAAGLARLQLDTLCRVPAVDLLDGLFTGRSLDDRAAFLSAALETMRRVGRRTAHRTSWGLRLPLATAEPGVAVAWWVHLAEVLLRSENWRPSYFWTETGGAGELILFFRPAPSHVVAYLLGCDAHDGTVVSPGVEPDGSEASAWLRDLLRAPGGSAQDLIGSLASGRSE
jgi:type VI secretion system protein ImpM